MLNEQLIDKVVERLVRRIEQGNEYVLNEIGKSIKKLGTLSPSKAQELAQILKYGGDYDKIAKRLAKIANKNINDIYKIFEEVAKNDYKFAKQFYEYRNIKYIPFEQNTALKEQIKALAEITAREYTNISKTTAFATRKGRRLVYTDLSTTYQNLIDEATLNVGQGKETFDTAMKRSLKQLGQSGIRTVDYASGRSIRLDTAVRMNMKAGLTHMHDEMQKQIGKEFDADGVEISVHENPAPDHEDAQGKQFTNEEYDKLQTRGVATSYDNETINMHLHLVRANASSLDFRPIGEYNCYHYIFSIVLGISEPNYTKEQLQEIKGRNNKGFTYKGRHYTMYEGTQLQRNIETEIRKQKDIQIVAKSSDNKELIQESQMKISELTRDYRELSRQSGLPEYMERMSVSGYRRTKVELPKVESDLPKEEVKVIKTFDLDSYREKLGDKEVYLADNLIDIDEDLLERNIVHLDYLTDKYNVTTNQHLEVNSKTTKKYLGATWYRNNRISLNTKYFNDKEELIRTQKYAQKIGWHNKIKEEDLDLYTITHEYGHAIENDYIRRYLKKYKNINTSIRSDTFSIKEENLRKELDKEIRDEMFDYIRKKENLTITEIKNRYFSKYGKTTTHYEWFAETFAQLELGEKNLMTEAMEDWLERNKI